jgi:hypothetical protein
MEFSSSVQNWMEFFVDQKVDQPAAQGSRVLYIVLELSEQQ